MHYANKLCQTNDLDFRSNFQLKAFQQNLVEIICSQNENMANMPNDPIQLLHESTNNQPI